MPAALMEVKDVCKSFANDGAQSHVLNGVSLRVGTGDFVAVMGSSGSGKSTLLYAIGGMYRATSGSVLYGGEDLVKMPEKRLTRLRCGDFGFVFQQSHLVGNLTLRENIAVPGYLNKFISNKRVDERTDELLGLLGLEEAASRYPNQVSGGQQQRCAIARGVINEPALLFADEPAGALNRANSDAVLDLFCELNGRGQTVFMVTHDVKSAIRANRIIYLEDGRVTGELPLPRYDASQTGREEQVGGPGCLVTFLDLDFQVDTTTTKSMSGHKDEAAFHTYTHTNDEWRRKAAVALGGMIAPDPDSARCLNCKLWTMSPLDATKGACWADADAVTGAIEPCARERFAMRMSA